MLEADNIQLFKNPLEKQEYKILINKIKESFQCQTILILIFNNPI